MPEAAPPGLRETVHTPDILKEAGIDYVFDWVIDDLPSWIETKHVPLLAMPCNLEINVSIIYAVERHATGEMLARLAHAPALRAGGAGDRAGARDRTSPASDLSPAPVPRA